MQIQRSETTFAMKKKGEETAEDEFLVSGNFPRFKLEVVDGFVAPISNPIALLTGFDVEFEESESTGDGRPFGNLEVRVEVEETFDTSVTVKIIYGLRDWSGDWDDEHAGTIRFAVLAD